MTTVTQLTSGLRARVICHNTKDLAQAANVPPATVRKLRNGVNIGSLTMLDLHHIDRGVNRLESKTGVQP